MYSSTFDIKIIDNTSDDEEEEQEERKFIGFYLKILKYYVSY